MVRFSCLCHMATGTFFLQIVFATVSITLHTYMLRPPGPHPKFSTPPAAPLFLADMYKHKHPAIWHMSMSITCEISRGRETRGFTEPTGLFLGRLSVSLVSPRGRKVPGASYMTHATPPISFASLFFQLFWFRSNDDRLHTYWHPLAKLPFGCQWQTVLELGGISPNPGRHTRKFSTTHIHYMTHSTC